MRTVPCMCSEWATAYVGRPSLVQKTPTRKRIFNVKKGNRYNTIRRRFHDKKVDVGRVFLAEKGSSMAYWMVKTEWDEKLCDYTAEKVGDPLGEEGTAYCSECGGDTLENSVEDHVWSRFCPHCGAKMENWQSDEQREIAHDKWWENYRKKREEERANMTPEQKAWEKWCEEHGPRGGTGIYWREDYEGEDNGQNESREGQEGRERGGRPPLFPWL